MYRASAVQVLMLLILTADVALAQSPGSRSRWDDLWDDGPAAGLPRFLRPWREPDDPVEPPTWGNRQDRRPEPRPDSREESRPDSRQDWRDPEADGSRPYAPNRRRPAAGDDDDEQLQRRQRTTDIDQPHGQKVMDGGPQPEIRPIPPQRVFFAGKYAPGTLIIETSERQLLLVVRAGEALRYPISVGREGFTWTGTEHISRIADWPDWHPPEQMRERDPKLPEMMRGGLRNPLGAKALYLGDTLYRIHGTNDAKSIGHASSSGCFRMLNGHVVDLASRVRKGTTVVVIERLPRDTLRPIESSGYGPDGRSRYRY